MQRKIIQLAVIQETARTASEVIGLCDDGAVMVLSKDASYWSELPSIPQKPIERNFIGQNKINSEAYVRGFNDRLQGLPLINPYPIAGSKEHSDYDQGWAEGVIKQKS